jgi:glycogen operon protein
VATQAAIPTAEAFAPSRWGSSHPVGANLAPGGVNLSVYAKRAIGVDVLLFDDAEADAPARVIELDPAVNRTGPYWHAFLAGVGAGQVYALRAHGPFAPDRGLRFDAGRVLLDPYGRGLAVPAGYRRASSVAGGQPVIPAPGDVARAMKSVVVDLGGYDWEGDAPIGRSFADTVIYEAHVRGFTAHPSSGVASERRGTFAGFIERIPYLVDLGVTAIELLPVFAFDARDAPGDRPNYWGYQPVSFFAPHAAYSSRPGAQGALDEFRDLVKALHRAGLEVIIDVVYNHTAEGGPDGPTFCYRGLANDEYYTAAAGDRSRYADYSGTGNTLNANEPIVRRLILDSLRYWVAEMHVDGFRFDLASVLSRDEDGRPVPRPPVIWDIETDPILAGTKLIAEAWDAAGLYQVGSFAGDRWGEWNGRFRDDVRSFVKSDPGKSWAVAERLLASPDIYASLGHNPERTINFVTCHDGFTLNDVVSYDAKHNEANGEDNRDGNDQNLSWNCGLEGPSDDPSIEALRNRQVKNFLTIELLAVGVPMLTMGDEVRRTQLGNNNAYCQDSELSWFDWGLVERNAGLLRFCRGLIAGRRRARELFGVPRDVTLAELLGRSRVDWHGTRLGRPDTSDSSRSIALALWGEQVALHVILNAFWEALDFEVPPLESGHDGWQRIVDTSLDSPDDLSSAVDAPAVVGGAYRAGPRSVVVLAARKAPTGPEEAAAG